MTLDDFIASLSVLRDSHGGDVEVFHVQYYDHPVEGTSSSLVPVTERDLNLCDPPHLEKPKLLLDTGWR